MTKRIEPRRCGRCGHPVLPGSRGAWVDQANGRCCGGNPQYPHLGSDALAFPPPSKTKYWLTGGALIVGVVMVLGLLAVLGKHLRESKTQQAKAPTSAAKPASAPPAPGAPVPCDPDDKKGAFCFPADISGPKLIERINKVQQWPCFKQGQKGSDGMEVAEVELCQGSNTADQPYVKSFAIGYDTDTFDSRGTMSTLHIIASTKARSWKNETTDANKTADLAVTIFDTAVSHLWPDSPALRASAKSTFEQAQAKCTKAHGASLDSLTARMPEGYVVSCSSISPVSVTNEQGVVTSITESMTIDIPRGGGK